MAENLETLFAKLDTPMKGIQNFLSNFNKLGKKNQTKSIIQSRLTLLSEYWTRFNNIHERIMTTASVEHKSQDYFKNETFFDVENSYIEAQATLRDLLEPMTNGSREDASFVDQSLSGGSFNAPQHLPKITLPKFSGDYLEWPAFRDMFESLIHKNPQLSQVQKLQYLKANLTGEAARLIHNLPVTSSNYKSAWETLEKRYQNKRILINTLLKTLVTLPAVNSASTSELKRLVDGTNDVIRALDNLGRPVESWDDWLVYLTVQKLDIETCKAWENTIALVDDPEVSFKTLQDFLESRVRAHESLSSMVGSSRHKQAKPALNSGRERKVHMATQARKCPLCSQNHILMFCPQFKAKPIDQRRVIVEQHKFCFNCLASSHLSTQCYISKRCKICGQKHHTMLHLHSDPSTDILPSSDIQSSAGALSQPASATSNTYATTPKPSTSTIRPQDSKPVRTTSSYLAGVGKDDSVILLATANVVMRNELGREINTRALLDQGSEMSFISAALVRQLRPPEQRINVSISAIGASRAGVCRRMVFIEIASTIDRQFKLRLEALVLPNLTGTLPSRKVDISNWSHLNDLPLADPNYGDPQRVDLIIGANAIGQLLREGIRKGPDDAPFAQNTYLGWILSGPVGRDDEISNISTCHLQRLRCVSNEDLSEQITKFWEVEQVPVSTKTPDELTCSQFYKDTVSRDVTGRYIVRLPLKYHETYSFQIPRQTAIKTLLQLERRLYTNSVMLQSYRDFMDDYERLNHMEQASVYTSDDHTPVNYLPHHGVMKEDSTTTKLRVVFNASFKSASGSSLNDLLYVGPKLQADLFAIILRWRKYPIVFSADIEKMFRQIWIHPSDRNLQRIVWRKQKNEDINDFTLKTVTYGMACAPFLAIQTLHQLAEDDGQKYPMGAEILLEDTYVDDVLTGAYNIEDALQRQTQLLNILSGAGFNLRKWSSNHAELLNHLKPEQRLLDNLEISPDHYVRTLGIEWSPTRDEFGFRFMINHLTLSSIKPTKRIVLSTIAKLFDPLGWLSPVIIAAKLILQRIWSSGSDWDEELSEDLTNQWQSFHSNLRILNEIRVSRWIGYHTDRVACELHGFSDSSESAYAAAVYVRIIHEFGNIQTTLLTAKTKVAPLKNITLPRLELCGAVLLVHLLVYVRTSMNFESIPVFAWSDSTTVLAWIKGHPQRWERFVANRVSDIQTSLPNALWKYVASSENPADLATRGLNAHELQDSQQWWQGPSWLSLPSTFWPITKAPTIEIEILEEKLAHHICGDSSTPYLDIIQRFSSLTRLTRVVSYCLRFAYNVRSTASARILSPITTSELQNALNILVKQEQSLEYLAEIVQLSAKRSVHKRSKIIKLHPFVDELGILRAGGRLNHSNLSYQQKHPIVLPKTSSLVTLIIDHAHHSTLHGGENLTISYIRKKYWIIGLKGLVRQFIHRCVVCFRHRARATSQLMASLPRERVWPSRPFYNCGVDYAGPIRLRLARGRGRTTYKGYIALFVCFATKAVHIEAVLDLTTPSFLAALKRFISRRGAPSNIFSDNATNFQGANNVLKENFITYSNQFHKDIADALSVHGTQWNFIPAASPHFGGLWEAGIKSVKTHLRRLIGDHCLTYEELSTTLCQIEAVLNSRPLYPISYDSTDPEILTPGHFLVGTALTTPPEPSALETPINRLTRWQLVQHLQELFWKRWSRDYLHTLMQRSKWNEETCPIKTGDLVLVKEDNLPPTKWLVGRITQLHPGTDGRVRVVSLQCRNTTLKRPVVKLCVLPIGDITPPSSN